jgi:4-diphosphocytidyl-2-C-methyl-D-erythritol kinase
VIVERALAKVNLALHVLGRRGDGYHLLDSIVGFADVADVISIAAADDDAFSVTGTFSALVPTDESNLVLKAVKAVRAHIAVPSLTISLEKNLPVAGGIGGGSADAAAVLRALRRLTGNGLSPAMLHDIALTLGADVPVCLAQKISRMRGIGEVVEHLPEAPAPAIVLVNPDVPCLTSAVFQHLGLGRDTNYLSGVELDDTSQWRNDLFEPALLVQPTIAEALRALNETALCTVVRMSGSGATCFGLAHSLAAAEAAATEIRQRNPNWWVCAAKLQ